MLRTHTHIENMSVGEHCSPLLTEQTGFVLTQDPQPPKRLIYLKQGCLSLYAD